MDKFCDIIFDEVEHFCKGRGFHLHMIHLNKKLLGVEKSCQFPGGILGMLGTCCILRSWSTRDEPSHIPKPDKYTCQPPH